MTKATPLISVVVPCFNQGEFLKEALDSVLDSDTSNWECIVVDDGSKDSTRDVAADYVRKDPRFSYVFQVNAGLASARNTGISKSKGSYILPLDADDRISSSYLTKASFVLESRPEVKLVYSKVQCFGGVLKIWDLQPYSFEALLKENMIFCSSVFRRSDYCKTNGYDSAMVYGWEDWELWISLLEDGGEVVRLEEVHFFYRVRPGSMLRSMNEEHKRKLRNIVFSKHKNTYLKYFPDPLNLYFDKLESEKCYQAILNSLDFRLGNLLLRIPRMLKTIFKP